MPACFLKEKLMKNKLSYLLPVLFLAHQTAFAQPNFTVTSSTGNFGLTCINNSIQLTASSNFSQQVMYAWKDPHGMLSNVNPFTVFIPGTYTVIATAGTYTSSQVVTITDNYAYPLVIAVRLQTISCPGGTVAIPTTVQGSPANMTYTWSSPAGASTTGNNTATLTTNTAGFYTLAVTNTQTGCTTKAYLTVWACLDIKDPENMPLSAKVFPNPISGNLYFEVEDVLASSLTLRLTNSLGQVVPLSTSYSIDKGLDLGFLQSGIYQLTLQSEQGVKTFRILKE
jgi:hypothetical protein